MDPHVGVDECEQLPGCRGGAGVSRRGDLPGTDLNDVTAALR